MRSEAHSHSSFLFLPAIYENNAPTKLAFINYISDANASQYDAVVKIGAITEGTTATTPSEVYVRCVAVSLPSLYSAESRR